MNQRPQRAFNGLPPHRTGQAIGEYLQDALAFVEDEQLASESYDELQGARAAFNGLLQVIQAGYPVPENHLDQVETRLRVARENYEEWLSPEPPRP